MTTLFSALILVFLLVIIGIQIYALVSRKKDDQPDLPNLLSQFSEKNASVIREEVRANRQELNTTLIQFQESFLSTLRGISAEQSKQLQDFTSQVVIHLDKITDKVEEKLKDLNNNTEKRLEQMRQTVDEKLQKTLDERLGQSFDLVSRQLESVQKGLGEMQTLAQDVGGLKKVLSNVKMRGGLGEVRLEMLLEQILAPEQYEANVKTKKGSSDLVEFALKLPGKDDDGTVVYLPIDAKFPQEAYVQLTEAYEGGNSDAIESASRSLETMIKRMAKDIRDKYIDPPYTTDFGILFLPFEGIYAEVIRRPSLMEALQREFHIMVTGPTTLAAILNSLQMGFKTLAIQKRSSEVWQVLGAVKTEFEKFGGLLEKAQKNLHQATSNIDELVGKRTKAIQRKLRDVESLPAGEASLILPEFNDTDEPES